MKVYLTLDGGNYIKNLQLEDSKELRIIIPLRDLNPRSTTPYITVILILVNIGIFVFEMFLPRDVAMNFVYAFGFTPGDLTNSILDFNLGFIGFNIATIFSSMFLHGGFGHILSNMWALWLFGDNVENRLGHFRFLVIYFLSGFFAALAHYVLNITSPIVVVGASGAIAGVMGIYIILFPLAKIKTLFFILIIPIFINVPAFLFIGVWFLSQISSGLISLFDDPYGAGIAWWAHIGGFIYGAYIGKRYRKKRRYYNEFY